MNKKTEEYRSDVLDAFFQANENPLETSRTRNKMLLAAKIIKALKSKNWKKGDLAKALGKGQSEITKYLSGTHNFTMDTLTDIETVLDIHLIDTGNRASQSEIRSFEQVIISTDVLSVNSDITQFAKNVSDKVYYRQSVLN